MSSRVAVRESVNCLFVLSGISGCVREIFLREEILDQTIEAQYDSQMKRPTFRPDLTDYFPYIQALTDKLNEESIFKMSRTDAVKIAIELACKNFPPGVRVEKKRKLYQTLKI